MSLIQPRTLKGFRDFLPRQMLPREELITTAKSTYRSFGFSPIDTPVLEYTEILLGKGGDETDRQLYRFTDHGDRDVTMRYDLTVPLARYVAQHSATLGMPFKRYHVGAVWRGENTHRGRYREFMQCDFDTIGTESVLADTESGLVIQALFEALGFERFCVRVNDRKVLTGVLERVGLVEQAVPVLRALDKLAKIGPEKVVAEMVTASGASESQAREVLKLTEVTGDPSVVLEQVAPLVAGSELGERGLASLTQVIEGHSSAGIPTERIAVDLSIARGLDYYTGTIYETFLGDLPSIGSVCSGGRYDDLASLYTKERLPGIGASLGVDRLLAAMEELEMVGQEQSAAPVLLVYFEEERASDYLALAYRLRREGVGVELYPDARRLKAQLKYADRRGFRYAVIVGGNEWEAGVAQVKDLAASDSSEVALEQLGAWLRERLGVTGT